MNESKISYIKICAMKNLKITINKTLPVLKMPTLDELGENLFTYMFLFSKYMDLYEDKDEKSKDEIMFDILQNETTINEFVLFISFFVKIDNIDFKNSTFKINEKYINFENIVDLMDAISILHHRYIEEEVDNSVPYNSVAAKWMEEFKKQKKIVMDKVRKLKKKQANQGNNKCGFDDILSTIDARHPSINLLNIGKFNYYQLLYQYKRLLKIDKYTPCLHGNATEEYIKKNKVEHYSYKIKNE